MCVRITETTDPDGNASFVLYNDLLHEVRTYSGWSGSEEGGFYPSASPLPPTQVEIDDWAGNDTQTLTMSATPGTNEDGSPNGSEAIGSLQSLSITYRNNAGQDKETDDYVNVSWVVIVESGSPAVEFGASTPMYYATTMDYNARGLEDRVVSAAGTITRTIFDGQGKQVAVWVGTDDTPSGGTYCSWIGGGNMVQTEADVYDNGGVGDGNLTSKTLFTHSSQAADQVTLFAYDWRDRQVLEKDGASAVETDGTNRPITVTSYDNLDEVTETQSYDGDEYTLPEFAAAISAGTYILMTGQTQNLYDAQGRQYQSEVYDVDINSYTIGPALTSNEVFDSRGDVVVQTSPDTPTVKDVYDGMGEVVDEYDVDATGDGGAVSVGSDIVLSQMEKGYDGDGDVVWTVTSDRLPTDSPTAEGVLQDEPSPPTGMPPPGEEDRPPARVSADVDSFDAAGRETTDENVGTYTSPAQYTSFGYNAAGYQSKVTDPDGLITLSTFDALGQTLSTVEDATGSATAGDGSGAQNKTVTYTYVPAGLRTLTAWDGSMGQTTQYDYGVSTSTGSTINSNDIMSVTQYPNPSFGLPSGDPSEEETSTVDAQGDVLTSTDRNGTTHSFTYDSLGRVTLDSVTTLGSGVDGSVMAIGTVYNAQGHPSVITSYNSSGGVVNQDENFYNGFGDLMVAYQSVSGPVVMGLRPVVYSWYSSGMSNTDRPTQIVYPDGYTITYNYASGVDNDISRLTSMTDSSGLVESYTYLGVGTVLGRTQAVQGLTTTLDSFGNVARQTWTNSTGSTTNSDYVYSYDSDNNVLSRTDEVNSVLSQTYSYDGLNQLTSWSEGSGSGEAYTYDSLGNRTSVSTDGATPVTWSANEQNQITSAGTSTSPVYDNNGNMTTDQNGLTYTYDAWNRLVTVSSGGSVVETMTYDGLSRLITDTVGGVTTNRYYSSQDQVIEEQDASTGNWTARYVWSPVYVNALIFRDTPASGYSTLTSSPSTGATRLWAEQDANWNVVALVAASGTVVERYDYSAFGVQTVMDGTTYAVLDGSAYGMVVGYQGMRLDGLTQTWESDSRWLNAGTGSWMSVDPLGFRAFDTDLYRFVFNNPITFQDPSGKILPFLILGGVLLIGGTQIAVSSGLPEYIGESHPNWGGPTNDRFGRATHKIERRTVNGWVETGTFAVNIRTKATKFGSPVTHSNWLISQTPKNTRGLLTKPIFRSVSRMSVSRLLPGALVAEGLNDGFQIIRAFIWSD